MPTPEPPTATPVPAPTPRESGPHDPVRERPAEIGGRGGPDPVRYGDWEKDGRCIDF